MKTLLTLGLMLISSLAFSQKNKIPKNGTVKIYYPSEKGKNILKETGVNQENIRIGTWKFYTPDGKQDYTIDYQEDISSFVKKTYIDSIVISEEHFTGGQMDGIQTYSNSEGEKIFIYHYTAGKPDSSLIFEPKTGAILFRFVYHPNLSLKTYEEYFPSGKLRYLRSTNEKGQKDGLWLHYYTSDPENGTPHLNEKSEYKNGLLDGEVLYGTENCIFQEFHYKEGKKHGTYKEYADCQLKYVVEYDNDIKIGKGIHYFKDGAVNIQEFWSGKQDRNRSDIYDSSYTYLEDRSIELIRYQKQTENQDVESKNRWFYPNGKVKEETQTVNGQNHGIRKLYYENGILHGEIPYVFGSISGKMTFWYRNGKKKLELIVENRIVNFQKGWDESGKLIPFENQKYRPLYESENHYGLLNYLDDNNIRTSSETGIQSSNDGDFEMGERQNYKGTTQQTEYVIYDKQAGFPGGWDKMQEFIQQTKRFPEAEKVFKKAVSLNLNFVVEPDGSFSNLIVEVYGNGKELLPLFETEVKRIFSHMPLWEPAVSEGKKVSQKRNFIIQF